MKFNRIGLLILLLLAMSNVYAASFGVQLEPVTNTSNVIFKDEIASFKMTVDNSFADADRYLVYSLDPSWIVYTEPLNVKVDGKSSKTFIVNVYPSSSITRGGIYSFNLKIQSGISDETITVSDDIILKSDSNRNYQPAISVLASVGHDNVVDPRISNDLVVKLMNRNSLNVQNLTVVVEGKFFKKTYSGSISPNGDLVKTISLDFDDFTKPQNDTFSVKLYINNSMIVDKRTEYQIQKNKLFFSRDAHLEKEFMYQQYSVNLTNLGNIESVEQFSYPASKFQSIFTKTTPDSEYSDGSLSFNVALMPSESTMLIITTDYRALFYTSIIVGTVLFVLLVFYFLFRSPIVVYKRMAIIAEKDGGISEIKILLHIKNRSKKVLENIAVVDRIPDITEVEREFSLGTLKPTKIVRHPKKGTLIRWDFPTIDAFEERVISYKIHSKLGILGHLALPKATIRFNLPTGQSRAIKSNADSED